MGVETLWGARASAAKGLHMGMSGFLRYGSRGRRQGLSLLAGISLLTLGACSTEVVTHGQDVTPEMLAQVKTGSAMEQVLISLGTPSTTSSIGGDAFYYISQRRERSAQFLQDKVVDQRVIAVYFDKGRRVQRIANYGLQDGKVFDFISRTTPAGGEEQSFIRQIFRATNFSAGL
jgi:outer membrane protein assembly factor BamE (lipoprotein component of BamABCDE complex)